MASKKHSLIEIEAEAVAFVVCKAYGVDTQALSSEYIRLHRGDSKLLDGFSRQNPADGNQDHWPDRG
jgi:hypothetical protein